MNIKQQRTPLATVKLVQAIDEHSLFILTSISGTLLVGWFGVGLVPDG